MITVKTNCQTQYMNNHSDRKYAFKDIKEIRIEGEEYELFMKLRKQGRTYGDMLNIVIQAGFDSMKKEKVSKEKETESTTIECPHCQLKFREESVLNTGFGNACPRCGWLLRGEKNVSKE